MWAFLFLFLLSQLSAVTRVIIICCVLVKETYTVPRWNDIHLIVPPDRADTSGSSHGFVNVKYNGNEFYPLFFVSYQRVREQLTQSKHFYRNSTRTMGHYGDSHYSNFSEHINYENYDNHDNELYGDPYYGGHIIWLNLNWM